MNRFIAVFIMLFILLPGFDAFVVKAQSENPIHSEIERAIINGVNNSPVADQEEIKKDKYTKDFSSLAKSTAHEDRKSVFMNGNKIGVELYNYGGIGPGHGLIRGVNNFVWKDLSYIFTFSPIVGAEVEDKDGNTIHIISDGVWDYPNIREVSPEGDKVWQWQPLPNYADPDQDKMAANPTIDADEDGKPDSWPRSWYNPSLGQYVWPGYLSQNATSADMEAFWSMDDRENDEFPYYPFENDTTRRGLGIQVDGRAFQWSNALAENTIFFVYTITNTSDKDLDKVFFGIYGDPDIGGGTPENKDDKGFFIPAKSAGGVNVDNYPLYSRSMVYFYDDDKKGDKGLPLGYLGCKFLESPGNAIDGIDNDSDGMIDESQEDGIDNDNDWLVSIHDVGIDGVAGTEDQGEGDGIPTAGVQLADGSLDPLFPGEPNFELTDLDEADQIGLTSFNSWTWNNDQIRNDESMWNRSIPDNFSDIQQNTDIVFIFGSGYISLKKGETKRISMALICGEDIRDLLVSAETVQKIYNQNYQFYKPPYTPTVKAVPGDKKVTLYWDDIAESSIDPISGKDFQGYVIYRSTDHNFNDIQTITDGRGSSFLNDPLKDIDGYDAKWDVAYVEEPYEDANRNGFYDKGETYKDLDKNGIWTSNLEDEWEGYHPVAFNKRGIHYYLGDNSGLVHSFVDSNNVVNGQTYYYAVVAYDRGTIDDTPPTETTKKITLDPITNQLQFDKNTVMVVPGPRAVGYEDPYVDQTSVSHDEGTSTSIIDFKIVDDLKVKDNAKYKIIFSDKYLSNKQEVGKLNFSVLSLDEITDEVELFDTNFANLSNTGIADDEYLKVVGEDGVEYKKDIDYKINYSVGKIRKIAAGSMNNDQKYEVTYRYYPLYQSMAMYGEETNEVFDGIQLFVKNETKLEFDSTQTSWIEGNSNFGVKAQLAGIGQFKELYPGDYEIKFSSDYIDSAMVITPTGLSSIPVKYSVKEVTEGVPQKVVTFLFEKPETTDEAWTPGEEIVLFWPGTKGEISDTVTWGVIISPPKDSTVVAMPPTDGDVLKVVTKRPFKANDRYSFKTVAGKIKDGLGESDLDDVYVVPNPYVGFSEIEPTNKIASESRGERRIYFENLPSQCTIRIYSLAGNFVTKIEHDSGLEHGREYWNLLNEDGFSIAYGVYFAHINAPGIGEKIVKFAIIK
ncbi:MAG: hypothetical protein JEY94_04035 [Melioribacteraceae bacterium]|nr:hypothetical protein [Melioribacteraceae bacterium]